MAYTTRSDRQKTKSNPAIDVLAATKELTEELLTEPEIVKVAIKARNIKIKSLKANIEHIKNAYTELTKRYDSYVTKYNNLLNDCTTNIESRDKIIESLTKENKDLTDELTKKNGEINQSKIKLAINEKLIESTIFFKMEKLSEKIPGGLGKVIAKILSSERFFYSLMFLVFLILLLASFIGWSPIINIVKPIVTLFL